MKKQLLFIALFLTTLLNAQSIEFTSAELTTAEVGSTVTVNYKYTSTVEGEIYCAINRYEDTTWASKVAEGFLGPVSVGTDVTGSFDLVIPSDTELTADLTGTFNYKIVIEIKTVGGATWLAGAYPETEIDFVASTASSSNSIIITSEVPNAEIESSISVNYTYTSSESDSYIYVGLNLYDAAGDYSSFVIGADTGVLNGPGTDVTGSISFIIPAGTTLSADLAAGFKYKLSVEMKEKTNWTIIGSNYPDAETTLVAEGALSVASFLEEFNEVTLYPNPVKESLNIKIQNDLNISNIRITNVLGKVVKSIKGFKKEQAIDASNLASGIYILSINFENAIKNIKFIKD
jgi:hypothetical protein